MHVLSSILFAVSANTDNFVVGLSYGIKKIRIGMLSNLLIALISMVGTILSMLVGKIIFNFIPENLSNLLGCMILILIGCWSIIKPLLKNVHSDNILDSPEMADVDNSANIDAKESITLAFALTINNIGLGIGASITGLYISTTALFTFVFSMLMITVGYFLGARFLSALFSKRAAIICGLIIIALGIYELHI